MALLLRQRVVEVLARRGLLLQVGPQQCRDLRRQGRVGGGQVLGVVVEHLQVVGVGVALTPLRQHVQVDAETVEDRLRLSLLRLRDVLLEDECDLVPVALQVPFGRRRVAVQHGEALQRRLGGERRRGAQGREPLQTCTFLAGGRQVRVGLGVVPSRGAATSRNRGMTRASK